MKIVNLLIVSVLILITASCYYDNEEALYPELGAGCDATNPTFATTVSGVLNTYCLTCHKNSNAASLGGNISLEGYDKVKVYVNNGGLLGSIKHSAGFSQMPKGSGKLSACQIAVIENWINAGAPNN